MVRKETPIRWARKVPKAKIRRLYENDAAGICDEELIDDVGYSLLARCESILAVTEAAKGRALCHACGGVILHGARPEEVLRCGACGWEVTWSTYHKSYQHKQLFGGGAVDAFREFVHSFPSARTPREKVVLIDKLIHSYHWYLHRACRPAAANLIEGTMTDVIQFLNSLTYGANSAPELRSNLSAWQAQMPISGVRSAGLGTFRER